MYQTDMVRWSWIPFHIHLLIWPYVYMYIYTEQWTLIIKVYLNRKRYTCSSFLLHLLQCTDRFETASICCKSFSVFHKIFYNVGWVKWALRPSNAKRLYMYKDEFYNVRTCKCPFMQVTQIDEQDTDILLLVVCWATW